MPERLHEIRAAIPARIATGVRLELLLRREHRSPDAQRPALIERKRHLRFGRPMLHGRHAVHHVGVKRVHVLVSDLHESGIGHRGIQALAARADPFAQRPREILVAVRADAGLAVRRDVAADDRAERRSHVQAARIRRAVRSGAVWQPAQSAALATYSPRASSCAEGASSAMRRRQG